MWKSWASWSRIVSPVWKRKPLNRENPPTEIDGSKRSKVVKVHCITFTRVDGTVLWSFPSWKDATAGEHRGLLDEGENRVRTAHTSGQITHAGFINACGEKRARYSREVVSSSSGLSLSLAFSVRNALIPVPKWVRFRLYCKKFDKSQWAFQRQITVSRACTLHMYACTLRYETGAVG